MNFQTRRFDRIDTTELAPGVGVSRMPKRPSHVDTASAEDEHPVSLTTYLLAVVGFLSILFALGFSVGYWLRFY
jgi:hypothetical protein